MTVQRQISIKFEGMPSLTQMIKEFEGVANYMSPYTTLCELTDNQSTKPDLRELVFCFESES